MALPGALDVGPIRPGEMGAAVAVFLEAFHEGASYIYGDPPRPEAMIDVWSFAREVEPGGFLAARDAGGKLLGYAFITSSVGELRRQAIARLAPLRWAWRAVCGRYGIIWAHVLRLFGNKMAFSRTAGEFRTSGDAQLLNIATAAHARGRGVAFALVSAGLAYLRSRGVLELRLEVRPDNAPARSVYDRAGFVEVGRTRDPGGEWVVMVGRP